jgi:hypothetical protein
VSAWLFQDAGRGVVQVLTPLLPAGTFNAAGILVGPTANGAYTWPRPLRLLVWLLQWCTSNLFLIYAGTAFTVIGRDPHCMREQGQWAPFCGSAEPTVFARIYAIYARLGWSCHVVALALYLVTWVVAALSKKDTSASAPKGGSKGAAALPAEEKKKSK